jgi:hypothetical protein
LVIKIAWSKTIQFGDRKLEIPLVKIPNSPLCSYQAYTNMCKLVPADPFSDGNSNTASKCNVLTPLI